jgi:hypothetical protein
MAGHWATFYYSWPITELTPAARYMHIKTLLEILRRKEWKSEEKTRKRVWRRKKDFKNFAV